MNEVLIDNVSCDENNTKISNYLNRRKTTRTLISVFCAAALLLSSAACSSSSSEPSYNNVDESVQDYQDVQDTKSDDGSSKYRDILDKDVGDLVTFGEYEWYITEKSDSTCTLLCKDSLTKLGYNSDDSKDNTSWKGSQIYKWINDDENIHLTDDEKSVMVEKDDGYVTLLTEDEIENLDKSIDRTDGAWWGYPNDEKGKVPFFAMVIDGDDIIEVGDVLVENSGLNLFIGVRPAVRLSFDDAEANEPAESETETENSENYSKILEKDFKDVVHFGKYDWYIIDKRSDGVTLLSKDIVTKKEFYDEEILTINDVTWEDSDKEVTKVDWMNSTLHTWLNEDFYNEFSDEEKKLIAETKNKTDETIYTVDNVFLLSADEFNNLTSEEDLFEDESILICKDKWWLRNQGYAWSDVAYVENDLAFANLFGTIANDKDIGVRPAINLKFE